MPDTWITPRIWTVGERVGQSKINEISNNLRVLYPYTTGGDLAYRSAAGDYLARLALVVGGVLFGDDTAPAYTPAGTQYQFLMSNGAADPAFAALLFRRQGGDANNWASPGTTTYTPTATKRQKGVKAVTINPSGTLTVTYPVAFTNRPHVMVSINCGGGSITTRVTNDSVSGFDVELYDVSSSGSLSVDVYWSAEGL